MTTPDIWMAILDSLADDSENLKFINIGVKQWGISATASRLKNAFISYWNKNLFILNILMIIRLCMIMNKLFGTK
jgi:hypothetical protein